jgi:hypothetical protein
LPQAASPSTCCFHPLAPGSDQLLLIQESLWGDEIKELVITYKLNDEVP